jgi:hypothetical protein
MALVRCSRLGLLLPLLVGALCAGCGGDDDVEDDGGGPPGGEGPAGCYIGPEMRCDCEIEQTSCTEEGQTWVEDGCTSCAT